MKKMSKQNATGTRENIDRLNAAIAKALCGMKPPDDLSVSEWADKKRRLSPEASAETGQWRTSRTPYLKEPMDAFSDPKIRRIVIVSSSHETEQPLFQ